ncbi:hypothetical protein BJV77DRAFT_737820 [Russula vinacea]|nr:hypothetical protein BJV77DRAFT_737820 [Russula vinacea]
MLNVERSKRSTFNAYQGDLDDASPSFNFLHSTAGISPLLPPCPLPVSEPGAPGLCLDHTPLWAWITPRRGQTHTLARVDHTLDHTFAWHPPKTLPVPFPPALYPPLHFSRASPALPGTPWELARASPTVPVTPWELARASPSPTRPPPVPTSPLESSKDGHHGPSSARSAACAYHRVLASPLPSPPPLPVPRLAPTVVVVVVVRGPLKTIVTDSRSPVTRSPRFCVPTREAGPVSPFPSPHLRPFSRAGSGNAATAPARLRPCPLPFGASPKEAVRPGDRARHEITHTETLGGDPDGHRARPDS